MGTEGSRSNPLTGTFMYLVRNKSRWTGEAPFLSLFGILAESWLSRSKSLQRNKKGFNLCMHPGHARLAQGTQSVALSHFNAPSVTLFLGPEIT